MASIFASIFARKPSRAKLLGNRRPKKENPNVPQEAVCEEIENMAYVSYNHALAASAATAQGGPGDASTRPVIICWNFPYTTGIAWGSGVSQHNDGWAVENLPKFFQQACAVWEVLNRNKVLKVENPEETQASIVDETPVQVWISMRAVHYKQWRLESGKLTRRPQAKLVVDSIDAERGEKFQRTLGVELVDQRAFGREDWSHYGAGCFGDARDVTAAAAGVSASVGVDLRGSSKGASKGKGKGKKGGGKKGGAAATAVSGIGNLPVYQDEQSSTYIWNVVVEQEKRVGKA